MKNLSLFILFMLLPIAIFSQLDCNSTDSAASGKCQTKFSSGNIQIQGKLKNGQRHGKFTTYYLTGQKLSEVKYKKGKMNGMFRSYHMNGQIDEVYFVVDDLIQGNYIQYHDNGGVRVEGQMVDSQKVGIWNYRDRNGTIIESVNYDVVEEKAPE